MIRVGRTLPDLFEQWDRVAKRIRASRRVVLFLDFDGTLVEIQPLPGGVRLPREARRALEMLARHRRVTLAVISGRRRAELQRHIGIPDMDYLGLYGWERNGNAKFSLPAEAALARARRNLLVELATYPGVWIEPKRNSFSIHLLGTRAEIQNRVRRRVRELLEPFEKTLHVFENLRDIEVLPISIGDKGAAVRKFLGKARLRGALPIYFGDDWSDEPAFAAVRRGISILVGKRRPTRAQFYLRGPAEVAIALSRLEALL